MAGVPCCPDVARKIVKEKGQAQVVTATNVFAHIDDKAGLIEALNLLLAVNGVFVIEVAVLGRPHCEPGIRYHIP